MRPIKLVMSAFGPYAGRTEVDFEKLGKSGIYLITGNTGAGKTTIFDGISYALYGEASGTVRDANMFRSKYAEPSIPTEVELTFEYRGKEYKIKRNPTYERQKQRGEGTTKENADATLTMPDGRVITKNGEVTNTINEVIGLDANQFRQIVMIAQGDFMKLLHAKTDERKAIFNKIFDTKRYVALQNAINQRSKEIDAERNKIKNNIINSLSFATCDQDSPYAEALQNAKDDKLPLDVTLDVIQKLIDLDQEKIDSINDEMQKLNAELEIKKAEIDSESKYQPMRKQLAESLAILPQKTEELTEAKALLASAENHTGDLEKLTANISLLTKELETHASVAEKVKDVARLQIALDKMALAESTAKEQEATLTQNIADIKARLESLYDVDLQQSKLASEKTELGKQESSLTKLSTEESDHKVALKNYDCAKADYEVKALKYEQLRAKYEYSERAFFNEQAGILAENLQDGTPCPVCGSMHHPAPAVKSTVAPTQQELETLKRATEQAHTDAANASSKAHSCKAVADEKRQNLLSSVAEVLGDVELENLADALADKAQNLADAKGLLRIKEADLCNLAKEKSNLTTLLPKKESELKSIQDSLTDYKTEVARLAAQIDSEGNHIAELKSKLTYTDSAIAQAEIHRLEGEKVRLESAIANARKLCEDSQNAVLSLNSAIATLQGALKGHEIPLNLDEIKAAKSALDGRISALSGSLKACEAAHTKNLTTFAGLNDHSKAMDAVDKEYAKINPLSRTAMGELAGKDPIALDTFIQMRYFDRILTRANTRLLTMTDGQYEFKRRESATDKRIHTGLDLDIVDHHAGTFTRDVKSLSGGESFKASLALALGLSDEIQASAGGIQPDTMFIDEGFGSLDATSLPQVMKALQSLASGNRLVGIISHVAELQESIDRKIMVTKSPSAGSTIQILLP